ncbi:MULTISPECIES: helix-turn-helix domain-containing protein [unclassified Streptomyces]|uniref:helix-turn-helix domain-containing protein n=1 Tax=unclassified Streptomyces TaxID=2593676 RepID=UPI001F04DEA1|nr:MULTISPECIES: helix-turn-helix domain-containing protein [unclassified Streptomyces]MCH0564139.1 helix-turn-helix domain-containing protein [Streptomyces sp. MUM 2J]MCH0568442.1 helix-turn-helix domain-containing protein [Streptomyces sp. MUM 136J]
MAPACPETERFAAQLRALKSRSGLSYAALAEKSGIPGSTLHRYCRGRSVPQDYGSVHRLATVCGAAPDELRTLHRLWALADAARAHEAAEQEGADGPDPAEEARDHPAAGTDSVMGEAAATADRGPAATDDENTGPPGGTGAAEADQDGARVAGARPAPGRGAGRRRLMTALLATAAVVALGVSALALSNGRDAPGTGDGPGGSGDSRLLFSPACSPVVAMGQHDACAREVQRLLHAKGADIDVDGDFGPQTLRRVTAFQVLAGLPPNGVVGEPTKKALSSSPVRMDVWPPERVRQRIREVFPEAPDTAVAIADCQSFLDPLHILPNTNGTRNWGVFQISDARLRDLDGTPRKALDPEWNIQAARRLWSRERDFHDWPHCARAAGSAPSPSARRSP